MWEWYNGNTSVLGAEECEFDSHFPHKKYAQGRCAEWSKALAWKASGVMLLVGSNPALPS